ncbi:hypothetical protein PPACK8108_LOCUS3698 [Phakopsora pachyrhizi]|uniref:Uncharacterized protein n=1 Tax=Phakopsora pachyrhizi TaxID=170000 RepID=A0AAV0AMP6_PHAPC|nr:hypothetical protein PPACK8108_LOCUS3698 [Phakopsora pachyrhizi]
MTRYLFRLFYPMDCTFNFMIAISALHGCLNFFYFVFEKHYYINLKNTILSIVLSASLFMGFY